MGKKWKVLLSMLKVGLIGFGGGSALIPVLEREAVREHQVISKDEYDKAVIVASITPGALPVEIAGSIGRKAIGLFGMLQAAVMMALPGTVLTVLLISVLSGINEGLLGQIQFAAVGVTAFISCMLTEYIRGVGKESRENHTFFQTVVIILVVFALTGGKNLYRIIQVEQDPFFGLSTLNVLVMAFFVIIFTGCEFHIWNTLVAAGLCVLYALCAAKSDLVDSDVLFILVKAAMAGLTAYSFVKRLKAGQHTKKNPLSNMAKEVGICLAFSAILAIPAFFITKQAGLYLGNGWISSLLSFGGGDAYLTVADGLFVDGNFISEDDFYGTLVSVVNVLPGSILCKTLSGIGYYIGMYATGTVLGGCLTALAGFGTSIAASCGVVAVVNDLYDRFETIDVFQLIRRWIRPIISGLLLNVVCALVYQNVKLGITFGTDYKYVAYMAVIYAGTLFLFYKKRQRSSVIAMASIFSALVLCNV